MRESCFVGLRIVGSWIVKQHNPLRKHCTGLFLMQIFLESLREHCLGFSAVQCYPKSFKTTMNRNFFSAKLSGASRTTLHRVFTCAMLFGASWPTLHSGYYPCNIAPRVYPGTTLIVKTLCNIVFKDPDNIA